MTKMYGEREKNEKVGGTGREFAYGGRILIDKEEGPCEARRADRHIEAGEWKNGQEGSRAKLCAACHTD